MKRGSVVPAFLDDGQTWSPSFGLSWTDLMLRDMLAEQPRIIREGGTYLRKVCGTGGIPQGRNEAAAAFLDGTDGEWLWFVDTDMGFSPDTVDRLVAAADEHARPVVGGLAFAQRRTGTREHYADTFGLIPTLYAWREIDDEQGFKPFDAYPRDQLVQVDATGAACLLIHRRALRKVRQAYGDQWFDPITHPTALAGKPRTFSEDLSFCTRVRACGMPVWVDTSVKTSHCKGGIFLDEAMWDAQCAAIAQQARAEEVAA